MNLTIEQEDDLVHGKVVTVTIGRLPCVVLRADVYEESHQETADCDATESHEAVLQAWDADGSPDDATLYADYGRRS